MKKDLIKLVKELAGNEFLFLDEAISIKKTPHDIPVNIWSVCVSPDDQIYLMDSNEEWFELKEADINYSLVLNTVYQRAQTIYKNYQAD